MKRVMIQADGALLDRARRAARRRGITFPQLVREALERELVSRHESPPRLSCSAAISTDGGARQRTYVPGAWR